MLNDLEAALSVYAETGEIQIPPHLVQRTEQTMSRVKRVLMRSVWDDRWGDYDAFASWVNAGGLNPEPEKATAAARLFRLGELP